MHRPFEPSGSNSLHPLRRPSPASRAPAVGRGANAGRSPRRAGGFTLIEVMIVAAIISLLAVIAFPSYAEYVRRGYRADAQAALLEAAQFMQRFHSAHDRYDRQRDGTAASLPAEYAQAPRAGAARYTIALSAVSATRFTLEASPTGSQAGDPCGAFVLNSLGQRTVKEASRPTADCWR